MFNKEDPARRTLYFVPGSCALGSIIALCWSGLPFAVCRLTAEETKSATYLSINPMGQVPALTADRRVVTESGAILNHIGASATSPMLAPDGSEQRDRFNSILSFLTGSFHPSFGPLFHPERFAADGATQQAVRSFALKGIRARYRIIEDWLCKSEPTLEPEVGKLVSAYLFGIARWGFDYFDVTAEYPVVAKFQSRMGLLPTVQLALSIESSAARRVGTTDIMRLADVRFSPTISASTFLHVEHGGE